MTGCPTRDSRVARSKAATGCFAPTSNPVGLKDWDRLPSLYVDRSGTAYFVSTSKPAKVSASQHVTEPALRQARDQRLPRLCFEPGGIFGTLSGCFPSTLKLAETCSTPTGSLRLYSEPSGAFQYYHRLASSLLRSRLKSSRLMNEIIPSSSADTDALCLGQI